MKVPDSPKPWGQQQADGSFVFPIRIRGLPAAPISGDQVARELCRFFSVDLTKRYDYPIAVNVAEDFLMRYEKETPNAPTT